tara:strand:+ start:12246 stop:13298 length:1053 start_codon:yes stop_codon:yes gene_type:complete
MKIILHYVLILFLVLCNSAFSESKYHHMPHGKFRNPEGSPIRDPNFKWSYKTFNEEKKKIKISIPSDHVVPKDQVLESINKLKNEDYILWIGHATFLIKLGDNMIISDPVFEKNMGPLIFGPKRYVDPAIDLKNLPKINYFLQTHNHYDHLSTRTIKNFPFKNTEVLIPLKLSKHFEKNNYKKITELDWYDQKKFNGITFTFLPSIHWSKRSLWDTNKSLWGSFLIEYKDKKILFLCDTGYGKIYKELGKKYGPIDITFINIGAYNFFPMAPKKDSSIYHTNPEEALQIGKDLNSKKLIGMHWGTVVLSLEPIMEPAQRFKKNASKFGYSVNDATLFKIGEAKKISELIK